MDYNPLAYVRERKLGTSQIWWLSKLALFNFTILEGLIKPPVLKVGVHMMMTQKLSDSDSVEVEVISYSSV